MNAPLIDYVDLWYKNATTDQEPLRAPLEGLVEADVCIIGAGFAGLTAAHHLAKAGRTVVVVESARVGWGASGRNGGFASPGYALGHEGIAAKVGEGAAKKLHRLSIEGMQIVANNIKDLGITAANPGILGAVRYDAGRDLKDYRDWLAKEFDYEVTHLNREELKTHLTSTRYYQALHDENAFHMDPLAYCLGLARGVEKEGGIIHEATPATQIEGSRQKGWTITTLRGRVAAREVVVTTGGYTGGLVPQLDRSYLPIATYVMTTRQAPELIATAIHTKSAIGDDRRAGDYYRLVDGGKRILWGGKITTRTSEPRALGKLLHRTMTQTYPQLADLEIDTVWSGLMSYARHRMPQIGTLPSGLWHCTAFGGHGVNTASIGGRVVAEAILGQSERSRQYAPFALNWTGGLVGMVAVQLKYWQFQAMDAWRERKA